MHTCLSMWFSFCKVESLSSSSEFLFSKSFTLVSNSPNWGPGYSPQHVWVIASCLGVLLKKGS
ncbi:hypothetical protein IGI04_004644 [Brassica rapa subsp. trilocularis]|uniref:Uncharacterized protein n=1 Tax=Brassica rapa subsp. trilocularis TaxID=1813537 RepID=A0ABQ7NE33_BRACM|nr:hypothetical protein IGI04_004644 [Brassica rapa subsp. trilocularis]